MRMYLAFLVISLPFCSLFAQDEDQDAFFIRGIYDEALTNPVGYDWLGHLCQDIGGRLAGSPGAAAAVDYTAQVLDTIGLDTVYMQPCLVPHWDRGETEVVRIVNSKSQGTIDLGGLALGNSFGTGPKGLSAEVVEVKSLDEVEALGRAGVAGKIVFFNRAFNQKQIRTFNAYGGAVDQRVWGASKAAEYGAVGVLVRSVGSRLDDFPHTGTLVYKEEFDKIPAIAISTMDANMLSDLLKQEPVKVFMRNTSRMLKSKMSHNVVGEIKGSTHPDEIILVGGHIDSWDVGEGAHDDGAGCVHSMDALRILLAKGYKPKRTLRVVLFMNEENGLGGGNAYAAISNEKKEFHLAAIESDAGGFSPRSFSCDASDEAFTPRFKKLLEKFDYLEPYGLGIEKGGSGADISPLKSQNGLLVGLRPDSQRYFDYHHTTIDTFDKINHRELQLGAAAMASLVYLIDQYGL